ncbi:MAG: ATP-grasp domain-containing protein [Methylococcaceae bacterium]|nr:ATP-grasp domain-containing protein [Methylococcaceae bacterium]
MFPKSVYVLLVANSARMLAQAARLAGFKPVVIDIYGDQDTAQFAEAMQQTASLSANDLGNALDKMCGYPINFAVFGSGFENELDGLERLASRFIVLGNHSELTNFLQNKPAFFSLLSDLKIPYPDASFQKPDSYANWLIKPMKGQGGTGIRRYRCDEDVSDQIYWQKYQQGIPHSVLFLANGERSQIVGFNKQWMTRLNDKDEFIFSGIINATALTNEQKIEIKGWLDSLVAELSLKGLNSMDFIQSGRNCYVLEINPRPSASMQLYDDDLFVRHIKACDGELYALKQNTAEITGFQVVYATQDLIIPAGFQWPEGVQDLPRENTRISVGRPICSMIMHAQDPETVVELLQKQQEFIINALDRLQTHGL